MLLFPPFSIKKDSNSLEHSPFLLCKTLVHTHENPCTHSQKVTQTHEYSNLVGLSHLVHVKTKIGDKWVSPLIWCKNQFGPLSFVTNFIP